MSTLLINTQKSKAIESVNILLPGKGAAPIDLPNEDFQPRFSPATTVIDVVHNFGWYAGPTATSSALDKLPCVFLTEREQQVSSLISGALYYLNSSKKAVQGVASNFGSPGDPTSLLGKINAAGGGITEGIGQAVAAFDDFFQDQAGSDSALLEQHNLKSLEGIYLTKPTGFQYRLPFYDTQQEVTNTWGEKSENAGGVLGGLINKGMELVETVSQTVNITQPGVYIEKPKYFQHADEGESRTIKFPLLNTVKRFNDDPVQQNYELIWLLTFQNKPYKTSFSRTPPPKLYTVSVPGQFSMPYAYIDNLSIDFLGTIRRKAVSIPALNGKTFSTVQVEVPIPEAYEVSITFKSLISNYGNPMVSRAFATSINADTGTVTQGTA